MMSLEAKGSMKKTITYQGRGTGHAAIRYSKPGSKKPFTPSPSQRNKRMLYNYILARWQTLTDEQRAVYNDYVIDNGLAMSGWNYYYQQALKDLPGFLGLLCYCSFNELVDGVYPDLSGNGNNGTPGPSSPSNAPGLVDNPNPKFGKCLSYDGVDDRVNFGSDSSLETPKGTIEFWMYANGEQTTTPLQFYQNNETDYLAIKLLVDNSIQIVIEDDNVIKAVLATAYDNYFSKWTHVVLTQDGTKIRLYLNGVEQTLTGTNTGDYWTDFMSLAFTYFGFGYWGRYYGYLDEFLMYNRALPLAEIQKHYGIVSTK